MNLLSLKKGQTKKIKKIVLTESNSSFFFHGVTENSNITYLHTSPFSFPRAFLVNGSIVTFSKEACKSVEVY
ncbi:hypothetical protein JTY60_00345 [symbiont of Argiope bruennichi]|uniref:hypothetical protein n=1 Tax=symbiont of Argiope bruennichi TaxID=2810479 RepID=UPI003DA22162